MSVPRLRFKEFNEDWNLNPIDQIATVSSGGTPSRTNKEFWNGDIPWVTTSEVKFNIIRDTEQKITEQGLQSSSAKIFPKDTLLIAMYGQGKTRGQIAKLGIAASTNQACAAIILKEAHNPDFFFQYLQNQYESLRSLSNDGGQKNLSASLIKSVSVAFPNLPEQTKIANFLTAVDEKITQLTQKCDLLAQYKKGVMQEIFSQELRFKDDDGRDYPEWEDDLLVNYSETVQSGKSKARSANGDFVLYGSTGAIGFTDKPEYQGKAILIARVGANAGYIYEVDGEYCVSDNTLILTMKISNNYSFFFNLLTQANLNKLVFGSGQPLITGGQLKQLSVTVPSFDEQTKIANFLTAIDNKINNAQTQLASVKQYKQGLLQQMFV